MTIGREIVAEEPWLWVGLLCYALATLVSFWGAFKLFRAASIVEIFNHKKHGRCVLSLLVLGVIFLLISLTLRWVRIDHGPFVSLYELLMSQLFSLGIVFSWVYWRWPAVRPSSLIILPIVWVLGSWVLTLEPTASPLPPTYYNPWLWAHVGVGKIFLGVLLVATGLAGVMLVRNYSQGIQRVFQSMPNNEVLDALAWRFMILALVFDSLMLVFGAVWAQDAWGRFWKWDALETSAFLTWLAIGIGVHIRLAYGIPRKVGAVFIITIFCLAFATYFSTPFVSEAAHKGVI